jgi:glucan biosynthesis protein C
MGEQASTTPPTRLFHIDNLRIYLTLLVIVHHAAIAYGGSGSWPVRDPSVDAISPIFLIFFMAINQTYFMSAFFLLAGYFTPRSFERKGARRFLIDRLIRLGIPLLFYTTVLQLTVDVMVVRFLRRSSVPLWSIVKANALTYEAGHLWFLQVLLLFAVIYVVFRALTEGASNTFCRFYRDRFPPDAVLLLSVAVLGVLTFAMRLLFPVGVWFLRIQPGHFVHYAFCFFAGVLAYRGDWFRRLERAQARRWGIMALVAIPLFFPVVILSGVLENEANIAKLVGGPHWEALVFSIWDTILMVAITVFLLYFFRERFNRAGPVARSMAANVYTVYIIHQLVLIALNILMLPVGIPSILKFLIVSLAAIPLCFVLSMLIRSIPYTRRVLG